MAGGQILAFPIDIDRRPYNTLALPCECVMTITNHLILLIFLSTHADRQGVDISCTEYVFVQFVQLLISPPRIKLYGVKFCTAVHRRPRQGISHFCELCSP